MKKEYHHYSFVSSMANALLGQLSLPDIYNFYRDLGASLDSLQPGLISPVSDDDQNIVDAFKVIDEADLLRKHHQKGE